MKAKLFLILAAFTSLCALLSSACQGAATSQENPVFGQASLALEATATSGVTYRVTNALFTFRSVDDLSRPPSQLAGGDSSPVADIDLPIGSYTVRLLDGWLLQRETPTPGGAIILTDVPASESLLVSGNPAFVQVQDQQVSHVNFAFKVGADVIQFGNGRVEVGVSIDDGVSVNDGSITCPSGQTVCGGACIDTASDATNCGACGVACMAGSVCTSGMCVNVCPGGESNCAGQCTNTHNDNTNCGGCGVVCAPGLTCFDWMCSLICSAGFSNCGGKCVDTVKDRDNCGACGQVCGAGLVCVGSMCTLP